MAFLALSVYSSSAQKKSKSKELPLFGSYTLQITSKLINQNGGIFYIRFDSAEASFNKFIFQKSNDTILSVGSIGQPRMVEVSFIPTNDTSVSIFNYYQKNVDKDSIKHLRFYCTPGINTITLKDNDLVIKSPNQYQRDYTAYIQTLDIHIAKYINPIIAKYKDASKINDTVLMKTLDIEYQRLTSEEFEAEKVEYPFIRQHPTSPVSLYVLSLVYSNERLDSMRYLLGLLPTRIQELPTAINIKKLIKNVQSTEIGKYATAFTMKDTSGKDISLSDFKGKYVLIDFWASWCAPCRAENPNVVKVYESFKDKNFSIVGVSLDNNKENWLKAIKSDKLTWSQLSELKGWNGETNRAYAVNSIPANFLLDPNGKIIAKNLREDDLENVLKKVLLSK